MYWAMYGQTVTSFGKTVGGIWESPNTYWYVICVAGSILRPSARKVAAWQSGRHGRFRVIIPSKPDKYSVCDFDKISCAFGGATSETAFRTNGA